MAEGEGRVCEEIRVSELSVWVWIVVLLLLFQCLYLYVIILILVFLRRDSPPLGQALLIHEVSRSRTTVGRTPLDEWSARRRGLYLTTHNSHKRQTSILPVGFEPTVSAGERPQTYALDRAATGTGRTPLDEWSARRRDLYLTTHNSHKRQTSILPVGFEPTVSAGERP